MCTRANGTVVHAAHLHQPAYHLTLYTLSLPSPRTPYSRQQTPSCERVNLPGALSASGFFFSQHFYTSNLLCIHERTRCAGACAWCSRGIGGGEGGGDARYRAVHTRCTCRHASGRWPVDAIDEVCGRVRAGDKLLVETMCWLLVSTICRHHRHLGCLHRFLPLSYHSFFFSPPYPNSFVFLSSFSPLHNT